MTKIKYDFFNLEYHSSDAIILRFDGDNLGRASYLNSIGPPFPIEQVMARRDETTIDNLLVQLHEQHGDITDEKVISQFLNAREHPLIQLFGLWVESEEGLISLNNLLYSQHRDFLRRCPLKLQNGKEIFDSSALIVDMGHAIQFLDEEEESYLEAVGEAFETEEERWELYANIYQTGFTASSILIYLEKLLIDVFKLLSNIEPDVKPDKRKTNLSIIDGKIKTLQQSYDIQLQLPPKLAATFLAARGARNMFTHGDWENIDAPFKDVTARDLIESAYQFTCLLFEALNKKYS